MASCGKHVANATVANRLELPFLVTEPMAVDLDKLIWRLGKLNAPKARFCGTRSFQIESYKYNCLVGPQQAIYMCVCSFSSEPWTSQHTYIQSQLSPNCPLQTFIFCVVLVHFTNLGVLQEDNFKGTLGEQSVPLVIICIYIYIYKYNIYIFTNFIYATILCSQSLPSWLTPLENLYSRAWVKVSCFGICV